MSQTLLHTCCGPCASACVPRLKESGHDVTLLFANSNIDTREEFEKRFHEAEKLAAAEDVVLVALPYDHEEWLREVAAGYEAEPEKGARCARCFRYNLSKAAAYAAAHGFDAFTTSLTVSPHKDSKTIFSVARSLSPAPAFPVPFLPADFKKREGFKLSTRRAAELGLYRQSYCGCEFSKWRVHHAEETVSTNLDARVGRHGDVYAADFQRAGRGRLDHKWLSPRGANLMMSVVLSVDGLPPEQVATLPLVIGLSVARALSPLCPPLPSSRPVLKWPNDILVGGRKIAGILCERLGDRVIAGIGVNVKQTEFDPAIAARAVSLAGLGVSLDVPVVRTAILVQIDRWYGIWRKGGFAAVYPEIGRIDFLKGREVSVCQSDSDLAPVTGVSDGIRADGSLAVAGKCVYAGEVHLKLI